jgi:hypothetical protein
MEEGMSEWMNYTKEKIEQGKEDAFVWYSVASRWFLMGSILLYVASCVVAGGMVGPVRYIEFIYHCCHFEQAAQAVVMAPKPCAGPVQTDSPKRHAPLKVVPESKF